MADFLKILESKIDFSPTEAGVAERWFRQVERDNLFANSISSGGGGGGVTSVDAGNISIEVSQGLLITNPPTGDKTIRLDPDGDAWFGSNIDDPDTTTMFIISNRNIYNGETFYPGDLLIGSNSAGKGNMWWDASAGKLYFRSGTTAAVEIGDGGIVATWGQIGGWSIDSTRIYKSQIELDSAADEIRVGTNKVVLGTAGITAIAGSIGGWSLSSGVLTASQIVLDADNDKITIGTGIDIDGTTETITIGSGDPHIVLDGANAYLKSSNYSADAAGWRINELGNAEFNSIKARGKITTAVFEHETIAAIGGFLWVSKNAGTLNTNFTTGTAPDVGVPIIVDDSIAGNQFAEVGDILVMRAWNGTIVSLAYMTVTGVGVQADGATTYTVDFEYGDDDSLFQKGIAIANSGPANAGNIVLSAGEQTTKMAIYTHGGEPWNSVTTHAVLGNMRDTYDTGSNDRYGIGIGVKSTGNYMSYNAEVADEFIISFGGGAASLNADGLNLVSYSAEETGPWAINWLDTSDNIIVDMYSYKDATTEQFQIGVGTGNIGNRYAYYKLDVYGGATSASTIKLNAHTYEAAPLGKHAGMMIIFEQGGYLGLYAEAIVQVAGVLHIPTSGFGSAPPGGGALGDAIIGGGLTVGSNEPQVGTGNGDFYFGGDGAIVGGLYIGNSSPVTTNGRLKISENMYLGGGIVLGYASGTANDDMITFYQGTTRIGEIGSDNTTWLKINPTTAKGIWSPQHMRIDGGISTNSSISDAGGGNMASLQFTLYEGTTVMGTLSATDTTWCRLNQSVSKNIYTPQYLYANQGMRAGSAGAIPVSGDVTFAANLRKDHYGTDRTGHIYVPVVPDNTGTSWWSTAKSTGGTTITVSSTFAGIPANVVAISVRMLCRDSATHPRTSEYFIIGPDTTTNDSVGVRAHGNNMIGENTGICNVTSNTIYAYRVASGSGTLDCWLAVHGYFI